MSNKIGWISIHRKLQNNWLWQDKPFSQGQAWIDILLECNHEERQVAIKNVILTANRGESLNSLKTWSERFGWNISATRRFLKKLQKAKNIDIANETVTTRITICNYDTYQIKRNADETQVKRKRNASETQVNTNNKIISKQINKKEYSDTIKKIVRDFYSTKIKKNKLVNPKWETNHKFFADSCDIIDKLHRIDDIPFDVINEVLRRSISDEFWQNQIISLAGLRSKGKNKQMKFTNAAASLLSGGYSQAPPQRKLLGYRYRCPACENETVEREYKRVEEYDAYTCKVEGCAKTQLVNKNMVGSTLLYIEKVYKDES